MFRPTRPQLSLFEVQYLLPASKVKRLRESWARPFREQILEAIEEEVFRDAFCENNGRPNKSIRLLTAVHLLKELFDMTDGEVIEQVEFNLQWQYALGLEPEEAHLCQKTMHNYRVRLMEADRARTQFEELTRRLAAADGIRLDRQRLDSTHVMSNMAVLTRLGLFVETVTKFLRELQRECPSQWDTLVDGFERRYLAREGFFADAKRVQARRRLQAVTEDLHCLLERFAHDASVTVLSSYELLRRLFDEQCEVVPGPAVACGDSGASADETPVEESEESIGDTTNAEPGGPADGAPEAESDHSDNGETTGEVVVSAEAAGSNAKVHVQPRDPKTVSSSSMQSPHDPDATYGHKGKGFEVQLAETCSKDNPYQMITAVSVNGAHESDQHATMPMLRQLDEAGMLPEEMLGDTAYGSGANIIAAALMGVVLITPVQDPSAARAKDSSYSSVMAGAVACAGEEAPPPAIVSTDAPRVLDVDLSGFAFNATITELICCAGDAPPVEQRVDKGVLYARFGAASCSGCPAATACPTRQLVSGDRTLRAMQQSIATEVRQYEQTTPEFKEAYKDRSGIEATNHELKDRHGLGDLRVRGRERVTLAAYLKALSLNVKRAISWNLESTNRAAPCTS